MTSENIKYFHLLIIEEGDRRKVVNLDADTYSIGRDETVSIRMVNPNVSRHHALLYRVPSKNGGYLYHVVDGDIHGNPSKNGLFVNGEKCRSKDLHPEDVIELGYYSKLIYCLRPFTREEFQQYGYGSRVENSRISAEVIDPTLTLIHEKRLSPLKK